MELEIRSTLEIFSNDNKLIGKSELMDFDDKILSISVPQRNGSDFNLSLGDVIKVIYYTDKKIYGFNTIVRHKIMDNIILFQVDYPEKYKVIQRREHVRIPVLMDLDYVKVNKTDAILSENHFLASMKVNTPKRVFEGVAVDLSGSGIAIVTNGDIEVGENLIISMKTTEIDVVVTGQVMRVQRIRNGEFTRRLGIQFENVKRSTREKIIQYVFFKMRQQIKSNN